MIPHHRGQTFGKRPKINVFLECEFQMILLEIIFYSLMQQIHLEREEMIRN